MEKIYPENVTIKIRLEKNSRGGKIVTVLFELPNNDSYFEELSRKLKSSLGTGGTFKDKRIEIQGDHKVRIREYLEKLGFKVKLT